MKFHTKSALIELELSLHSVQTPQFLFASRRLLLGLLLEPLAFLLLLLLVFPFSLNGRLQLLHFLLEQVSVFGTRDSQRLQTATTRLIVQQHFREIVVYRQQPQARE